MARRRLEFSQLFDEKHDGAPRYERIAQTLERLIQTGSFRKGDRLPPIRRLAEELEVSGTTIATAYRRVSNLGWIRGEAGRDTLVIGAVEPRVPSQPAHEQAAETVTVHPDGTIPWRRRALMNSAVRLRYAYPVRSITRADDRIRLYCRDREAKLAFCDRDADTARASILRPRDYGFAGARRNGFFIGRWRDAAPPKGLVAASSAQQLMMLALRIVGARAGSGPVIPVAVEESGYPTIFDAMLSLPPPSAVLHTAWAEPSSSLERWSSAHCCGRQRLARDSPARRWSPDTSRTTSLA